MVLLKFDFDTKKFPGFCTVAIKSCWGQDKTITERKISVNLSHHISFLNRRQIFVLLAMLGKDYPLRFSLQPHIISFIQTDLPNLPFSLQLTVQYPFHLLPPFKLQISDGSMMYSTSKRMKGGRDTTRAEGRKDREHQCLFWTYVCPPLPRDLP